MCGSTVDRAENYSGYRAMVYSRPAGEGLSFGLEQTVVV